MWHIYRWRVHLIVYGYSFLNETLKILCGQDLKYITSLLGLNQEFLHYFSMIEAKVSILAIVEGGSFNAPLLPFHFLQHHNSILIVFRVLNYSTGGKSCPDRCLHLSISSICCLSIKTMVWYSGFDKQWRTNYFIFSVLLELILSFMSLCVILSTFAQYSQFLTNYVEFPSKGWYYTTNKNLLNLIM